MDGDNLYDIPADALQAAKKLIGSLIMNSGVALVRRPVSNIVASPAQLNLVGSGCFSLFAVMSFTASLDAAALVNDDFVRQDTDV
jgi:hypothetical protein